MNNYSHEQKEKLARKINKIKNKNKLVDILKLIQKDDAYSGVTENNNGLFMLFHKLSDETYMKIEKFIKKMNKNNPDDMDPLSTENVTTESITTYSTDNYPFESQSRLKYSNREKCIIKRKLYNDALNDMNLEVDENSMKIEKS